MALDDLPVRVESWTGDVPDRQAQVKKRSADFGGVQLAPHHSLECGATWNVVLLTCECDRLHCYGQLLGISRLDSNIPL